MEKERATAAIGERLESDLKVAMKARDVERVQTLRLAISALRYRHIERNTPLLEDEEIEVLRKQVKQRDDAIELYSRGSRDDLAAKEGRERSILLEYLPKGLEPAELRKEVETVVARLGPGAKFGDAMKAAMSLLKDRAEGKAIQDAVRAALASAKAS